VTLLLFNNLFFRSRQIDIKSGSMTLFTVNIDEPTVILDDSIGGGQSQTGALAHLFGGEEWLKYLFPGCFI